LIIETNRQDQVLEKLFELQKTNKLNKDSFLEAEELFKKTQDRMNKILKVISFLSTDLKLGPNNFKNIGRNEPIIDPQVLSESLNTIRERALEKFSQSFDAKIYKLRNSLN